MMSFDYKNKISFILPKSYLLYILKMIEPIRFSFLYRDIYDFILDKKKEEGELIQQKEQKHLNNILDELKEIDTVTDTLIKRQTALSLLYSIFFNKAKSENDTPKLTLNIMLAYELYIVIADEQLRISREIKEIDNGTHKSYLKIQDVNERSKIKNNYLNEFNVNKKLINTIFKDLSYVEIHKVRLDYNTMSVLEHLEYCKLGA